MRTRTMLRVTAGLCLAALLAACSTSQPYAFGTTGGAGMTTGAMVGGPLGALVGAAVGGRSAPGWE